MRRNSLSEEAIVVPRSPASEFCRQVRARSAEHRAAVRLMVPENLHGTIIAILRQELDSMVRTIFLLSIEDRRRRAELIQAAIDARPWTPVNSKQRITDREMVERANDLQGWTRSVYQFGCAFVHLSGFHDYHNREPMELINADEREAIVSHMRCYHGGPIEDRPRFQDLVGYLPAVFEKIASNLECYLKTLEADESLENE